MHNQRFTPKPYFASVFTIENVAGIQSERGIQVAMVNGGTGGRECTGVGPGLAGERSEQRLDRETQKEQERLREYTLLFPAGAM